MSSIAATVPKFAAQSMRALCCTCGSNVQDEGCLTPRPDSPRCATTVQRLYKSTGYIDELAWAAAWLYKATGSQAYLADARAYYAKVPSLSRYAKVPSLSLPL